MATLVLVQSSTKYCANLRSLGMNDYTMEPAYSNHLPWNLQPERRIGPLVLCAVQVATVRSGRHDSKKTALGCDVQEVPVSYRGEIWVSRLDTTPFLSSVSLNQRCQL